jgi:hypothetical protein
MPSKKERELKMTGVREVIIALLVAAAVFTVFVLGPILEQRAEATEVVPRWNIVSQDVPVPQAHDYRCFVLLYRDRQPVGIWCDQKRCDDDD